MDNLTALFRDMRQKLNDLSLELTFGSTAKIVLLRGEKKIFTVTAASINACTDIAFSKLMDYKKTVLP